ncbi:glycoside hydrolase family 19 protein [Reichenbachiella sp.]|uniref:glycoside hydrolase family 19 protein n=1 Tax=Reichenbachiella sp. TaxID=2184521 RepID=UPI003BB1E612
MKYLFHTWHRCVRSIGCLFKFRHLLLILLFIFQIHALFAKYSHQANVQSQVLVADSLVTEDMWNELFPYRYGAKDTPDGWVLDPADDFFTYASFVDAVDQIGNIKAVLSRRCGTNAYVVNRVDKTTNVSIEIRHDEDFDAIQNANKEIVTIEVDYADFLSEGDLETRKRELTAFLANIAHETTGGWPTAPGGQFSWGLHFREEVGNPTQYRDEGNLLYPPSPGKSYHGRGPMQLSWNYNYGQASEYLFGDKQVLLDEPERLVQDASLAFQTAIWFWMTPQYPKPSAHDVMAGHWSPNPYDETKNRIPGLGMTVNIINGGIECGQGIEKSQVLDRIGYYERFTGLYQIGTDMDGVHDLSDCGCKDMSRYGGDTGDLSAEPCAQQPTLLFTSHADGDAVKQTPLSPIAVSLSVDTKASALQNLTVSVDGQQYTDSTFSWTPSSYRVHQLDASAVFANGSTATNSISLLIWDETHIACTDVANWSDTQIYNTPGHLVVYEQMLYENKYYAAPTDIPGVSAAWEGIKTCTGDTTNQAPSVAWISPTAGATIVQSSLQAITLQLNATDIEDGDPAQGVTITVGNDSYTATKSGTTYEATFVPAAYGDYVATATATDSESLSTTSTINFSVQPQGTAGNQKIIGYLPTWIDTYDIKNDYRPESVTHMNISFLMFQQNNNNYNSADFASIAFDPVQMHKVDSVLTDCNVLSKSQAAGTKVSVALGGATDYAFLWLMEKYYNDDAKMEEIATLIADYIASRGIDGIDLDMECFWADAAITGTTDQGGRVRGSNFGDPDQGPSNSGTGLRILTQKLRAKIPNKLITAAVFATSWYGNNYDDTMAQSLDWLALMTYDFTGSWNDSPEGPHSTLYDLPLNTYPKQNANNPIYSADYALKYWMGLAPATWNHDGGFDVTADKLVLGVPLYGYDFSRSKPNGGNGAMYIPYKDILAEFPNAATSYDANDPNALNGHADGNGRNIYYDTPKQAAEKLIYSKDQGHQGVIVWELTQDVDYSHAGSIMRALNDANTGGPTCPAVSGLHASDIGLDQATIQWGLISGVSTYELGYKLSSATQWTNQSVSGNSLSLTGLTPDTSYSIRVNYTCSDGTSVPYATVTFTTLSDVVTCQVPGNPSSSDITQSSATISWTGTSPQHTVSYRLLGASAWQTIAVAGQSTSITGLLAASTYEVQIVAHCSVGDSESVSLTFITLDDVSSGCAPAYANYPSVYQTGDIVGYQGRNYECQVNNLYNVTPGTAAHWWKDLGACGDDPVCLAVSYFAVQSFSTNTADLSWVASSGVSSYLVEYKLSDATTWSPVNVSGTTVQLSGLQSSTGYDARISYACPDNQTSPYSTLSFTTAGTTTCDAVNALAVSDIQTTSALSTWIGDAQHYLVSYRVLGTNTWTEDSTTVASYTFANLISQTTYELSVIAKCNSGQSTAVSTSFTTLSDGGGCSPVYEPYPTIYQSGDLVSHEGTNYECLADNLYNVVPGTAAHWWRDLGSCQAMAAVSAVSVYPVPNSTGTLHFDINESQHTAASLGYVRQVDIIDNANAIVLTTSINDNNPSIDISSLSPGIYYVQLENHDSLIRISVE